MVKIGAHLQKLSQN